jgi:hypothetical protein
MADGYHVSPPALVRLAGTFTEQQQNFRRVGGPIQPCAAALDTGEAALDTETRSLVDTLNTLFGLFGDGATQTGTVLTEIAEDYEITDRYTAEDMSQIVDERLGDNVDIPQVSHG